MSNRPRAPLFATVNVTGVCNLRCRYCFFQPRLERHMSWLDFQHVLRELTIAEPFFVNLSGGEPFTHPEICRLLELSHETFRHVVTLTNGTLLRPEHRRTIERIVLRKGSFPIQVSIDAVVPEVNDRTRGLTRRVHANLERLAATGADIVVAMVVNRHNVTTLVDSVVQLADFARHFHIMSVQAVPALNGTDADLQVPGERLDALWRELAELRRKHDLHIDTPADGCGRDLGSAHGAPCMAAFSHLVIDPDLRVRPCDRLVDVFLGDLKRSTLREIWEGDSVRPILASAVPYCRAPGRAGAAALSATG